MPKKLSDLCVDLASIDLKDEGKFKQDYILVRHSDLEKLILL